MKLARVLLVVFVVLPPVLEAAPLQDKAVLQAASDRSGVLLRWHFGGGEGPKGGVTVFRKAAGEKDFARLTKDPLQPDPAALDKLVAAKTGRPAKPVVLKTAQEKREQALVYASLADADADCARALGLFYADTTPAAGTKVAYQLRAADGTTVLAASTEVAAGQIAVVPKPALQTAESKPRGVTLAWKPGATGFHVERAVKGAKSARITRMPVLPMAETDDGKPAPLVSWLDGTAKLGDVYTYTLVAVDAWGRESDPSNAIEVAHRDTTPPKRPTGLAVSEDKGAYTLSWKAPVDGDLAGYHVYRGREKLTKSALPKSQLSFRDVPGQGDFSYSVTSIDTAGNESPLLIDHLGFDGKVVKRLATPVVVRTPDKTPPATPTGAKASLSGNKVTVSWTASKEADLAGYAVYRAPEANAAPWKVGVTKQPAFVDTVQAFLAEDWYYSVAAVDKAGNESAPTASIEIKVAGIAAPRFKRVPSRFTVAAAHPKFALDLSEADRKSLQKIYVNRTKDDPYDAKTWEPVATLGPDATEVEDTKAKTTDGWYYSISLVSKDGSQSRPRLLNPPIETKVAADGKLEYGGLSITLSGAPPAAGSVAGTAKLPGLDATVNVKAGFQGGACTGVDLDGSATVAIDGTGATLTFTDIDFGKDSQKRAFVELDGSVEASLSGHAIAKKNFSNLRLFFDGSIDGGIGLAGSVPFDGFDLSLTSFDLGKRSIAFNGRLKIADAIPALPLKATFANGAVSLPEMNAGFDLLGVHASGKLKLGSNEVSGKVELSLEEIGFSFEGDFVVGRQGDFRYFKITADVPVVIPIGQTGLIVKRISGGLAWNMAARGGADRITFAPSKGSMCFMAGVAISSADGGLLEGEFKFAVGDTLIRFEGSAKVAKLLDARAVLEWSDDGFYASCEVGADLSPLASVTATLEMKFGKRRGDWYVALGTPESPCTASILGGLTTADFYFTIKPGEARMGFGFGFDTGRMELGPFWAEAGGHIRANLTLKFGDWSISSFDFNFYGDAYVEAGCASVSFGVWLDTHGRIWSSGRGLKIHGNVRVRFEAFGEVLTKRFEYDLR